MQQTRQQSFMKGALLITVGSLISRLLGALYRPLAQIPLGDAGLALVSAPNAAYMIILAVAATGLNVAISRLVSQRLAVGDLRGARRVVQVAATILGISGIGFSAAFALSARWLAEAQGFPEATPGFLVLAPAILLVTVEVTFRGLYQGMQQMRPAAVSMVVEQIGRVFVGLIGIYLLTPIAVNFGAAAYNGGNTIGVFLAALYGLWIFVRERPMKDWTTVAPGVESWENESFARLAGRILAIAVPLSFLGAIVPLMLQADTAILKNRLVGIGVEAEAADLAIAYIANAQQLRDLPLILAQALYMSLVPAVSEAMAIGQPDQARERASAAMRLTWLIGLPATIGLVVAARDAYGVLYRGDGYYVLGPLGWSTIFLMLQQTSSGILQGMGLIWLSVRTVIAGVVVKIVLTYWWAGIPGLRENGAAWATTVGFFIAAGLNLWALWRYAQLRVDVKGHIIRPLLASLVMAGGLYLISPVVHAVIAWQRLAGLVTIILGILIFGAAILALGGLRESDLRMVPGVSDQAISTLRRLRLLRGE